MAQRPSISGQPLEEAAKMARLDLSDARKEAVAPALDMVHGLVDLLDGIELGDVPPASSFNARWV
ncbi:hypothetical protein [Antricoccus suffuscus]|nr:hypothetical protein [Antricoccus suffuscus]